MIAGSGLAGKRKLSEPSSRLATGGCEMGAFRMKEWRKAGSAGAPARRSGVHTTLRKRLFHIWLRVCLARIFAQRARAPALPVAPHTTRTNLAPQPITRTLK